MCGLAGFLQKSGGAAPELEGTARRMSETLRHRGPDDEGVWVDPVAGIALGHRRLSIVDLSPAGHQPMRSACGRYVIVFNGEIYNFPDLGRELAALGHTFRGHSDTEVLLSAVTQWGLPGALERANGMFAFALWDRQERALHLVRDRLGEKPMYYGWIGDVFLFGSELKALRAHPSFRGEISRNSLATYTRLGYIPGPFSIYEGVFKLPAGTRLTVKPGGKSHASLPVNYWSVKRVIERSMGNPFSGSLQEASEELDRLLRDAVKMRMLSDVPLGAFLSGGIDSSTIVSLMQAQSARPVRTFSIGFHEPEYNEAHQAAAVARHIGTDHTELYVTPEEARGVIPRLSTMYDEPFADASQIPTHLVSQLARRHVTVSLSGDGGDELFGGYDRYFLGRALWRKIAWLPAWGRRAAAELLRAIPARFTNTAGRWLLPRLPVGSPASKVQKLAALLGVEHPESLYLGLVSQWKNPGSLVVESKELATALTDRREWADLSDFTQRMMFFDTVLYLPEDIMVKVDRASMAIGLESRAPFLDPRVLEFAWRLPLSYKVHRGRGKQILRRLLASYVPEELTDRPKMGFGVPIDAWLRGPLREWGEALLDETRLRQEGFFDPSAIRSTWSEHLSGVRDWQYRLWSILIFQAWLDEARTRLKALPEPGFSAKGLPPAVVGA